MTLRVVVAFVCVVAAGACPIGTSAREGEGEGDAAEGEGEGEHYPEPDDSVAAPVGTEDTLDLGAWNLKNFPCGNQSDSTRCRDNADGTPSLVADIVYSMKLDLLGVEEIDDEDAFQELVDRLPDHDGALSTHVYGDGSYQKIGFLYDTRVLTLSSSKLIFEDNFDFPRPPLEGAFTFDDGTHSFDFIVIDVHLKAGNTSEDHDRRLGALDSLESYVRGKVDGAGVDAVFVMGDFNEVVTDDWGQDVFAPFLDDPARYLVRTETLANQGEESFLFSGSVIDHIVSTVQVDDVATTVGTRIPHLDNQVSNYAARVSDHLPVTTSLTPR